MGMTAIFSPNASLGPIPKSAKARLIIPIHLIAISTNVCLVLTQVKLPGVGWVIKIHAHGVKVRIPSITANP